LHFQTTLVDLTKKKGGVRARDGDPCVSRHELFAEDQHNKQSLNMTSNHKSRINNLSHNEALWRKQPESFQ